MNYLDLLQPGSRKIVFADAGINHDGGMDKVLRIVDVAAQSGADYVDEVNEAGAAYQIVWLVVDENSLSYAFKPALPGHQINC